MFGLKEHSMNQRAMILSLYADFCDTLVRKALHNVIHSGTIIDHNKGMITLTEFTCDGTC